MKKPLLHLLPVIFACLAIPTLQAQTIYRVNAIAEPGGDGLSWKSAFRDLQNALEIACATTPSEIWVAAGSYFPTENQDHTSTGPLDRTNTFTMCNGVTLYGGFAGTETDVNERDWLTNISILDGDLDHDTTGINSYNVVNFLGTDNTSVLDGFTVTHGIADTVIDDFFAYGEGGGIRIHLGNPVIRNCIVRENQARLGAGIHVDSATVLITGTSVINNVAIGNFGRGAGISITTGSNATITGSTIQGNSGLSFGGGIYCTDSQLNMDSSTLAGNTSSRGGGLYCNFKNNVVISRCTFSENRTSGGGGGLYTNDETVTVINHCIFTGNTADGDGGGLHFGVAAIATITHSEVLNNTAYSGGGIYATGGAAIEVSNSRISGNMVETHGGGISLRQCKLSILSSIVSGNLALYDGGGINAGSTSVKIINSTITGNEADRDGGGILTDADHGPIVINSILWNNLAGGISSEWSASVYNAMGTTQFLYSLIANSGGSKNWNDDVGTDYGNNIDADPLFVQNVDTSTIPNTTGDFHLQPGSPAINAGILDTSILHLPAVDLDQLPRIVHGRIDMGAYEFQGSAPLPECIITGPGQVVAATTNIYTAPAGMSSYQWQVDGLAQIMGEDNVQTVSIHAGAVNGFLVTLTVSDGIDTIICAVNVKIEDDCALFDTISVLYVREDASGAQTGLNWGDAFTNLQDALAVVCPSIAEIWVAAGTYYPTGIFHDREASFYLKNNIAIYGGFIGTETALDQRDPEENVSLLYGDIDRNQDVTGNVYNVVKSIGNDTTAVIDGFTVTGGYAEVFPTGRQNYSGGGGFYLVNSSLKVHNCNIIDNMGGYGAGWFNINSSPTITQCTFAVNVNSFSGLGGGMHNRENSNPELRDCVFRENTGYFAGGGMYNSGSHPALINCGFEENKLSRGNGRGAGMANLESSPYLRDCIFFMNDGRAGQGGGMQNVLSSPVLVRCSFTSNEAKFGCGLANRNNSSPVLVDCKFSLHSAEFDGEGGGMYNIENSNPELTRCLFDENYADAYGGGMYNNESSPRLTDCVFFNNEVGNFQVGGGGGMANVNATPVLTNCHFDQNHSFFYGGGIYSVMGSTMILDGNSFTGNAAAIGGAISMEVDTLSVITRSWFSRNSSVDPGGAIYMIHSNPSFVNCAFTYNTAQTKGGAFNVQSFSSPDIINCVLMGNTAFDGGGIYNETSTVTFTNTTLSGNDAVSNGGAIYNETDAESVLTNSILWNNLETGMTGTPSASIFNGTPENTSISFSLIDNSGGSQNWNEVLGTDLGNNIDIDPQFVEDVDVFSLPDSTGNLRLRNTSPAIHAGTIDTSGLSLPEFDLDTNDRIVFDRIDLGPYEYQLIIAVSPDPENNHEMNIFPNPADQFIQITCSFHPTDILVINPLGQVIIKEKMQTSQWNEHYTLDVSDLQTGIYSVQLFSDTKVMVKEFKVARS